MIIRIGRIFATVVAIVSGLFVLTDMFVTQWPGNFFGLKMAVNNLGLLLVSWAAIVTAFALLLGFANVMSVHANRIRTRQPGAMYSGVLLLSLIGTLVVGFRGPASANGQFLFNAILQPLEATFSALLVLFMATAAYRAMRIRDLESLYFALIAFIVLLGQPPIGTYLQFELPIIGGRFELPILKDFILEVPALAGMRGILLGVALGTIATGLRVLMGLDRPYAD
jgi:hypothetical protein